MFKDLWNANLSVIIIMCLWYSEGCLIFNIDDRERLQVYTHLKQEPITRSV